MYKSHGFYEGEKKAIKKNADNKAKSKKKKGEKNEVLTFKDRKLCPTLPSNKNTYFT